MLALSKHLFTASSIANLFKRQLASLKTGYITDDVILNLVKSIRCDLYKINSLLFF